MTNKSFFQLKKNLKKDSSNFNEKRVAILGDSATQFLNQVIKGLAYDYRLKLDIWESEYDQISLQVFDPSSDLYSFNPDFIIIFKSSHNLLKKYDANSLKNQSSFAMNQIEEIKSIYLTISKNINSKIIFYNYTEINDSIFGNFSNKVEGSFLFQQRKLNYLLMELAVKLPNLYICDLSTCLLLL